MSHVILVALLAMLLSTPAYLLFLAATFFAFWLVDRSRRAGWAAVLLANYFFYARWDVTYLAIIPLASTMDFLLGRQLDRATTDSTRRLLVGLSVTMNIGLIFALRHAPVILPITLSFYAFQSLTYTIDIYRRDAAPTTNYLAYLCSASFFPTALAGPITRLSNLIPQMEKDRLVDARDGATALFLIGMGLTKKLLIADYLAENLINRVFDLPKLYSATEVLLAVYGYAFQLYNDFSGYTDIALGSALLLGIKLPANFNSPYTAENIADFWRRWHISLSSWLRDYLFFSLPGLRSRWKVFTYLNLILTMTLGGLWHGANLTFAVWGLMHGLGLAAVRWMQMRRGAAKPSTNPLSRLARIVITFHFVTFAWIFFRAPSLSGATDILARLASLSVSFTNISSGYWIVLAVAVLSHYVPQRWYEISLSGFIASPSYVQAGALALLAVAIHYVAATGAAPFIYTRF